MNNLLLCLPDRVVHRVASFMRRSDYATKLQAWWRMIHESLTYKMILDDLPPGRPDPTSDIDRAWFRTRWMLYRCFPRPAFMTTPEAE